MAIVKVPFIFSTDENEFHAIYAKKLLGQNITYQNIPIVFSDQDFFHICYEKGPEGAQKAKFGLRRSRRLLVLKEVLACTIPSELRFEKSTGNYCLLCEELDFVIFLIPNPKGKNLSIGTIIHFGEGFTKKIQKQRDNSNPVEKIEFKEI